MSWLSNKREIDDFIAFHVLPPGEEQEGFCDAMTYDDAIEFAKQLKEEGKLLLSELEKRFAQVVA
jgi:hypothetical protein